MTKGSLETRPWLPSGVSLGFTSTKTAKADYPDADAREERGEERDYDKRVGRVVLVNSADREEEYVTLDDEATAEAYVADGGLKRRLAEIEAERAAAAAVAEEAVMANG